jgi:hypothetical protein
LIKHVLQISQIHQMLTSLKLTVFGVLILLNGLIYTYLLHRVGTILSSFYHMMSNYSHFSSNYFHMLCDPLKCYLSVSGGVEPQVVKVTDYRRNVLELEHNIHWTQVSRLLVLGKAPGRSGFEGIGVSLTNSPN